jgi:hypothetical protein
MTGWNVSRFNPQPAWRSSRNDIGLFMRKITSALMNSPGQGARSSP